MSTSSSLTLVSNLGCKKSFSFIITICTFTSSSSCLAFFTRISGEVSGVREEVEVQWGKHHAQVHAHLRPCSSVLEFPALEANSESLPGLSSQALLLASQKTWLHWACTALISWIQTYSGPTMCQFEIFWNGLFLSIIVSSHSITIWFQEWHHLYTFERYIRPWADILTHSTGDCLTYWGKGKGLLPLEELLVVYKALLHPWPHSVSVPLEHNMVVWNRLSAVEPGSSPYSSYLALGKSLNLSVSKFPLLKLWTIIVLPHWVVVRIRGDRPCKELSRVPGS